MSTTDPPLLDARLLRALAVVNGAVPIGLLGWDAAHGQLGANGVNFAIRTTGMLGLVALALTLLVTPLRRWTGLGVLVAARRALGLYAFAYLSLHFAIFFALDRGGSVSSTVREVLERQYLQVGALGLLMLVPLAVTSTDAMVARLGARRWKALHRLTYVAAAAGSAHYLMLVKSDLRQPLAFAAVIGGLLACRAARHYRDLSERASRPIPTAPAAKGFWKGELRVAKVFRETEEVRTFRLRPVDGGPLPFEAKPGQYLNLTLEIDGRSVRRSYTIASPPTRADYCEITVRRAADGYASRHLHEKVVEGSLLSVGAPAGRFTFTGEGASRVLLIAGGVGITPLMAMVRALTDRCWPGRIDLVVSARDRADLVFGEELAWLASRFEGLRVMVTLTREPEGSGWAGERGRVTAALLRRAAPGLGDAPVYLCGPEAMMEAVRGELASMGVDPSRVHTEAFVSPPPSTARPAPDEAPSAAPEGPVIIRFSASRKDLVVTPGTTVLEAAEAAGVAIPFDCRSGVCGQCRTRLVRGSVAMESDAVLTESERREGMILACQSRPREALEVDA